jgi:hypothetical protein
MGLTVLNLEVANPNNPQQAETLEFLIDSGAIYLANVAPDEHYRCLTRNVLSQAVRLHTL